VRLIEEKVDINAVNLLDGNVIVQYGGNAMLDTVLVKIAYFSTDGREKGRWMVWCGMINGGCRNGYSWCQWS